MAPGMLKDEASSKAAKLRFKKRKECIMKKARELSVLCDIKVCALVSDPDNGTIETWPENRLEFQEILKDHVVKKMEKNGKVVKDNNKSNICNVGDESFFKMVDEKLDIVNKRIAWLTKLNNDKNPSFFVQNLDENSATPSSQSVNCTPGADSSSSWIAPSFVQPVQSFFVQNLHENSAIPSSQSGNCNPGAGSSSSWIAPSSVQPVQSGFSICSQFSQPLQCVEPGSLGEFEEFRELLQLIPDNAIDTTRKFPYVELQPQEFQMEDNIFDVQQNTTDEEEWRFLQSLDLDSMLQAIEGF